MYFSASLLFLFSEKKFQLHKNFIFRHGQQFDPTRDALRLHRPILVQVSSFAWKSSWTIQTISHCSDSGFLPGFILLLPGAILNEMLQHSFGWVENFAPYLALTCLLALPRYEGGNVCYVYTLVVSLLLKTELKNVFHKEYHIWQYFLVNQTG